MRTKWRSAVGRPGYRESIPPSKLFYKQLATGKLLASSKLDLSLVLEQIASQVLWLEFFT
jgi:hypothetical protein